MPIDFAEISSTTRTPFVFVEFDASRAATGVQAQPYKVLLVGQRLTTGTVAANIPTRIQNADQAALYFGIGSQLAGMAKAHFANNSSTETWALGVTNPAGASATGTITFAGTATEAGTVACYVQGRRYALACPIGTTAAALATALVAALETSLMVTGAAVGGVVTFTSRHVGVIGNDVDLRVSYQDGERVPSGITATAAAMSGGSGDVTLSTPLGQIGDQWFNVIVVPFTDATNLTTLETELASRASAARHIGAVGVSAATGALATLATLGNTRNAPRSSIIGTNLSPTPPWEFAAAQGAVIAKYAAIDPARPFQTLPLVGVLAPLAKDRWTQAERNSLLFSGISTFTVAADGTVQIERPISTYKTNPAGGSDPAWLDLNTPLTLDFLRFDYTNLVTTRYARHKLANDGTNFGAGQAIVTPSLMRAELVARFRAWEELGLVEDFEQFKQDLIVERNRQDSSRLDVLMPPNLVNGLRVLGTKIAFIL